MLSHPKHPMDTGSMRSSYNESPPPQSPDAQEYFGKWDSRSPSPVGPKVTFKKSWVDYRQATRSTVVLKRYIFSGNLMIMKPGEKMNKTKEMHHHRETPGTGMIGWIDKSNGPMSHSRGRKQRSRYTMDGTGITMTKGPIQTTMWIFNSKEAGMRLTATNTTERWMTDTLREWEVLAQRGHAGPMITCWPTRTGL